MKNLFKTLICLATLVSASASCFATNIDDFSEDSCAIISVGASLDFRPECGSVYIQSRDGKLESEYFLKDFATEEELINEITEKYISYSKSDIENNLISEDFIRLYIPDFFNNQFNNLS